MATNDFTAQSRQSTNRRPEPTSTPNHLTDPFTTSSAISTSPAATNQQAITISCTDLVTTSTDKAATATISPQATDLLFKDPNLGTVTSALDK